MDKELLEMEEDKAMSKTIISFRETVNLCDEAVRKQS